MNDKVYVKIRGLSAQEAGDAYKEAEDIEITFKLANRIED